MAYAVFRAGRKVDFSNAISGLSANDVETGVLHILSEWICKDIVILQETEASYVYISSINYSFSSRLHF